MILIFVLNSMVMHFIRACPCGPGFHSKSSLESTCFYYSILAASLWAFRSIPHANPIFYFINSANALIAELVLSINNPGMIPNKMINTTNRNCTANSRGDKSSSN